MDPAAELAALCDPRAECLGRAAAQYTKARALADYAEVVADPGIDAVLIATPISSHFALALAALRAGKHVFVEKPLASAVAEAETLVAEASRRGRVLMVDHVFVYTPAVRRIRRLIDEGALGDMFYYDSVRINLGLFQHDVNVIWDLAVHDLSIMDYLIAERPTAISAVAVANVPGRPESIAYLTCFFASGLIAHVHVNWLAPVKVRQTLIGGSRKMIIYDDLAPDEKVKVYDRGVDHNGNQQVVHDRHDAPAGRMRGAVRAVDHYHVHVFAARDVHRARQVVEAERNVHCVERDVAAARALEPDQEAYPDV
jgi:predicted dehydrogenase